MGERPCRLRKLLLIFSIPSKREIHALLTASGAHSWMWNYTVLDGKRGKVFSEERSRNSYVCVY
jgi:hypothetical protein